mmetsp:Transcript_9570/g.15904  ORF Transcript_9570/g.15904 Transcript_9570/m.15904 type:complete len:84 (-) Transcript_9570:52-303(-)
MSLTGSVGQPGVGAAASAGAPVAAAVTGPGALRFDSIQASHILRRLVSSWIPLPTPTEVPRPLMVRPADLNESTLKHVNVEYM